MQGASRPNVVLVSIDSLRADHCGHLGDDRGLTPALDALAEEGVAFRTAVAPGPQTFSSMPAIFTGHHRPVYDGSEDADGTHWERQLAALDRHLERYGSIVEGLSDLGYSTAGFSPNPWTSTASGWDRGFDRFVDLSGDGGGRLRWLVDRIPGVDTDRGSVELALDLLTGTSFFADWTDVYDRFLATRERLQEPYFLWIFLLDTHFPFLAGRAHREERSLLGTYASNFRAGRAMRHDGGKLETDAQSSIAATYRDAVRSVDAFLARLRRDLAGDDPVLFVHADHGESFGEHDNYGHHHAAVYEENVHVPYVVHNAGVTDCVEAPTSLTSVHDAVLETARRGTFDPRRAADDVAFAKSVYGTRRAARGRRFKLVEIDDRRTLFDLERDPGETEDRGDDRPRIRDALAADLSSFEGHLDETARLGRASRVVATNGEI